MGSLFDGIGGFPLAAIHLAMSDTDKVSCPS